MNDRPKKSIKEMVDFFGIEQAANVLKMSVAEIEQYLVKNSEVAENDRIDSSRYAKRVDRRYVDDKGNLTTRELLDRNPAKRKMDVDASGEKRLNNETHKVELEDKKPIINQNVPSTSGLVNRSYRESNKARPNVVPESYCEIIISDDDEPMEVIAEPTVESNKKSTEVSTEANVSSNLASNLASNVVSSSQTKWNAQASESEAEMECDVDEQFDDDDQFNTISKSKMGNFILNSFKTLLKAKKIFIDTDHLVSVIVCSLICTANDIYLYTNHSKYFDDRSLGKNSMNIKMILACTSSGIKFKPHFLLNHINLPRPLECNDNIKHLSDQKKWVDRVFKTEMELNMIYNCVCLTENEEFFTDGDSIQKFENLNTELIIIPNSIAQNISPFQRSILLNLNGYLHNNYIQNRRFPNTLQTSLKAFEIAWNELSEKDIENSFKELTNLCLNG